MIHAVTISLATVQRTADIFFAAPTPMIAPVMVCVVDTGMPRLVAANSITEPAVSAQAPCVGVSRVIFEPMVLTILQPPAIVPAAIAIWQAITTQNGT